MQGAEIHLEKGRIEEIKRRNVASKRSTFIAKIQRAVSLLIVSSHFVSSKPKPNLRFDKLNGSEPETV